MGPCGTGRPTIRTHVMRDHAARVTVLKSYDGILAKVN